jgi:hypothetical protein
MEFLRKAAGGKNMFKIWNRIGNVMKEENFLTMQVVVFAALPVLYFIYLQMTGMTMGIGIKEIFLKNPYESLNLLVNFSGVYSAYTIYHYKKDPQGKENFLAYLLVGLAQVCMANTLGIVLMLYSICYFTGLTKIKRCFTQYAWERNYKALFSAVLVLIIAIVLLVIRIRLAAVL